MTIRWKLNLANAAIIVIFVVAAAYAVASVRSTAAHTQRYLHTRSQAQLAADIRTDIYQHFAALRGLPQEVEAERTSNWPQFLLEDVEVQLRLAVLTNERAQWLALQGTLQRLAELDDQPDPDAGLQAALREADQHLRTLRHMYDSIEHALIATIATAGLRAEAAILLACLLAVLGFLMHLMMVRDWLVKPIAVLVRAADTLGRGELEHRVPLDGRDELARLGQRLDAMAEALARRQAELLEARELSAVGELCGNVAHGLKNPLAAMRAAAQMALRRSLAGDGAPRSFEEVLEQIDRMDTRITHLLQFSRPTSTQRDDMTFREVADAAVQEAGPLLASRQLVVDIEDGCGPRRWRLGRDQVVSALAELLTNAAHHSKDGQRIVVRGAVEDHTASLIVDIVDHGSGMPESTRQNAFALFFSTRDHGTGVGLAMVRRVVERHDGSIELQSEVGAGTTVRLRFPGPAAAGTSVSGRAPCSKRRRRLGRAGLEVLGLVCCGGAWMSEVWNGAAHL